MNDNDIKILKAVNESGDMADVGYYRTLDIGADSRLKLLEEQGLIRRHSPDNNSSYIGSYEITGKGYAFLSDYELGIQKSKSARKKELLSNIYIPLVVSIIANIIIALLKG